ncbi:PspC domain-containing protein [Nocardioides sediminis]|uniref:PspC domain-containing protein n=1 Tax=Nocardioides sediminis TaxID=433648 RepID=UPI00131EEA24|nr:PspC domain-containing protein [Nocardioides sediminis]
MDTTTPPPDQPAQPAGEPPRPPDGPRVTSEQMRDLGRLRRSVHDRHVAGVAGGLARHLDIDPIIVRVALVVLVFFGGSGLLLYAAGWLLVPEEGTDDQPLGLDERSRRVALIGAGVLAALAALGDWAGAFWFPWPVVVVALVVLWFVNRNQQRPPGPVPPSASAVPGAYPATGYGSPEDPATRYAYDPAAYARTRKPRKRGPVLLWATLALIAIGIGTLGVIDGAGTDVPDSAYPATAMAITGVMLVVGAFWGRAGGLILVGLVAAVATAATTASEDIEGSRLSYAPLQASEVRDSYDVATGDLTLDLSRIEDVDDLDGRDVSIDGGVGTLEVVVPDGVDVSVDASTGVGAVDLLGRETGGFGVQEDGFVDGGAGAPQMTIEVDLGIGQVTVREQ